MENIIIAFIFTTIAGLATFIGGLSVIFVKKQNTKFLSFALGLSAGVMLYVSMIEIFYKALDSLSLMYDDKTAMAYTVIAFFSGMLIIAIIDNLIPSDINPHHMHDSNTNSKNSKLLKMGLFTALAISIHNFPEGIATFIVTLQDPTLAVSIVFAIAIHNIPEGIAVALPIYQATGNRKKALWYTFLSGLSEPIGALLAFFVLMPFLNDFIFGILFASVAGIMVYIALDELLPAAEEYGHHHHTIIGVVTGMMIMAISLILFL